MTVDGKYIEKRKSMFQDPTFLESLVRLDDINFVLLVISSLNCTLVIRLLSI